MDSGERRSPGCERQRPPVLETAGECGVSAEPSAVEMRKVLDVADLGEENTARAGFFQTKNRVYGRTGSLNRKIRAAVLPAGTGTIRNCVWKAEGGDERAREEENASSPHVSIKASGRAAVYYTNIRPRWAREVSLLFDVTFRTSCHTLRNRF